MSTKGLKQLRERRDEIVKKWEDYGILDGLKPMKDGNLAELFQGETSYEIPKDYILPHARQVVNKMNELEKENDKEKEKITGRNQNG